MYFADPNLSVPGLVVVDYGVNNVGSVVNMFRRLGVDGKIVRTAAGIAKASAIVLPGIGSFDAGVQNLKRDGLFDAIRVRVAEGAPILGICLGMQLLTKGSEEGKREGLGLVPAYAKRFAFPNGSSAQSLKVPHMGWNRTECIDAELFGDLEDRSAARFYYVHSYHVVCEEPSDVAARCTYGSSFTAAVRRKHVMGTQFHPEKSHRFGRSVLKGFASIACTTSV